MMTIREAIQRVEASPAESGGIAAAMLGDFFGLRCWRIWVFTDPLKWGKMDPATVPIIINAETGEEIPYGVP